MRANDALVVFDVFDGEVMAVRNDTGTYYSMPGAAGFTWQALVAGAPVDEVSTLVAEAYGQPVAEVQDHVRGFVAQLLEAKLLLDEAPPQPGTAPPAPEGGAAYEAPTLQSYTDMQDLLLFDPIHEVEPTGWPQVNPPEPA